jgi:uridylate kinase
MSDPVYRRAIVKLSGEALSATSGFGIDQATVERLATDLAAAAKLGVELGVVSAAAISFAALKYRNAACRDLSAIQWACSRP